MMKKVIICGVFCVVGFIPSVTSKAALLYFMPQGGELIKDETAIIELRLDVENYKTVNAVEVFIKFNNEELEVKDFITGGSAIDLWLEEPRIINSKGTVQFSGGISKNISVNDALLGRLVIKPKKTGFVIVNYEAISRVLTADGFGTPLKVDYLEGIYRVSKYPLDIPRIFSRTHPDSNKWYSSNILEINWDAKQNVKYSYLISRSMETRPDDEPELIVGNIEYAGLLNGIYYFYLREKIDDQDWRDAMPFRIMIDSLPPEFLAIDISKRKQFLSDEFTIVFNAVDNVSGIDYYLVCKSGKICVEAKNQYVLHDTFFGKEIILKAVDKIGHERQTTIKLPFTIPIYFIIFLVFALAMMAVKIYLKFKHK